MNDHLEALKKIAGEMMTEIIRDRHKNESREGTAQEIIRRLNETELPPRDRQFVGSCIMSMYGYGGGL